MKPVIAISCPIDTFSGYGARSRDVVKALINSEKYEVKILSQRWGSTPFGFLKPSNPDHKKIIDCIQLFWLLLNLMRVLLLQIMRFFWVLILTGKNMRLTFIR